MDSRPRAISAAAAAHRCGDPRCLCHRTAAARRGQEADAALCKDYRPSTRELAAVYAATFNLHCCEKCGLVIWDITARNNCPACFAIMGRP